MKSSPLLATLLFLCITQWASAQTKLAFVAGVERYDKSGLTNLEYAEDDARQVQAELKKLGFSVLPVIGNEASLANLNSSMDRFIIQAKKLNKSDIVIVYFSGHGVQKLVQRKTTDGRTIEVEEPFFCPKDALKSDASTLLSLNTVLKRLEESSGSDHNIIMLDACRDSADKSGKGGIDGSTIRELSDKLALFFAAKSGRRSFESRQLQHGIFTHYLLEGLRGQAADSDNEVTFQGLASYVSKQVERNSPGLLEVTAADAQRPNLMGNLSGTIVLGKVDRSSPPKVPSEPAKILTNSLGMRLVRIEAGEFMMGNEDSVDELMKVFPYAEKNWFEDAANRHLVKITKPYYLGEHEVTVGQFRRFVEATGYKTEAESDGKGGYGIKSDGTYEQSPSYTWKNPGFSQNEDHPVVNVSWNDALKFCQWLARQEGQEYRLPTEAEWEYACRAGTRTRYWNGNEPEGLAKIGNVADRTAKSKYPSWSNTLAASDGFANTAPVGSFAPNPWGLYDMHGNVWEWCSDVYGDYPSGTVSDPIGPVEGPSRVLRGGCWVSFASFCRSAFRLRFTPDYRDSNLGFRVAVGR